MDKLKQSELSIHLLALALRLEGEGQYNLAKLARAAVDAIHRKAAYQQDIPTDRQALSAELRQAAKELSHYSVSSELVAALEKGTEIMAGGQLPLIEDTPHPYVCRTCGYLTMQPPEEKCPTCGAWPGSFQRFLPVYWLDALEPFDALARLRQTPEEVEQLIEGLTEGELEQKPADGGWAVRNALSHLLDAQGLFNFRVELFINEDHPSLEAKAVFTWATNEDSRMPTAQEIYDVYKASRAETIQKLEALPLKRWWNTGEHEEFGTVTLRQQVSYFASHEITHLPQIETLRRQLLAGRG